VDKHVGKRGKRRQSCRRFTGATSFPTLRKYR
jgi:hypothetical protein